MSKVAIVIKETYLRQVKSWAFVAMVFAPFLVMGLSMGFGWLSSKMTASNFSDKVALISQETGLKKQVKSLEDFTTDYEDVASAKKALKEEDISGYVTVDLVDGQAVQAVYYGSESLSEENFTRLTYLLEAYQNQVNLSQAGLSADQGQILARQMSFKEEIKGDGDLEKAGRYISFYALVFLMYMILLTYTASTAQDIASEKGTKIMEVIFSSIPAPLYFYGRILGIFAVISTHIGIYAVGGFLSYQLAQQIGPVKEMLATAQPLIDSILGNISISTVFFIIFGVFIYVVLAALCGSLVTRMEDANKAVQPLMYLIMLGFFGVFLLGQSGDSLLLKVGSYLPFLSTFFMPVRVINGDASNLEALLSLAILLASTLGLVFYIGRSYAGLILQTDDIGLWKSFKKGIASR